MTQYLLNVYQPDGPPLPAADLEPIMRGLEELNRDLVAAGAWVFSAGLHPASSATVVRPGGADSLITDGPFVEGKEHVGGFTVIEAPNLDVALDWAGRMARVTGLPIEVRPFQDHAAH